MITAQLLWQKADAIIPNLSEALIVLISGLVIIPLIRRVLNQILKSFHVSKALRQVTLQLISYTLYGIWFIALMYSFGFTGIAATLSGGVLLIGVGVGQAFKDLLANVIAGFAMARDRDFEVGYEVEIAGKTTGIIKNVGTRKVRLVDDKGRVHVLPNTVVETSEWIIIDREPKEKTKKGKK